MEKNQKATINHVSDDNKYFQFTATVTMNHEKTGKHPERISKIKPYMNKCNWKGIHEEKMTGKSLRKIIQQLLSTIYMLKMNMYPAHIPEQLKSRKVDHSFNDSKWRNMTSPYNKKISALLRVKTSKHDGDFYCLNYLYSFRRKNKLELHKKYVKITIFVVL